MMKRFRLFLSFVKQKNLLVGFLAIILSACQDVIHIDLNDVEPQIVIEGTVTDQPAPYKVKISKTGDYFEPSTFPAVSNAIVMISDDAGRSDTLQETEDGIYQSDLLQGIPGRTYKLTVTAEENDYTASSTMPDAIPIDSLGYEYQTGGFGPGVGEGYRLHCHFIDRAGIPDYCRFKIYQNGQLLEGYFLYEDKYTDGNHIDFSGFEEVFELNDTLRVELLTIDEATFDYYSTLKDVIANGGEGNPGPGAGGTPANPNTNLSNGALGYFGAFTIRTDTIIIQ